MIDLILYKKITWLNEENQMNLYNLVHIANEPWSLHLKIAELNTVKWVISDSLSSLLRFTNFIGGWDLGPFKGTWNLTIQCFARIGPLTKATIFMGAWFEAIMPVWIRKTEMIQDRKKWVNVGRHIHGKNHTLPEK